MIWILIIGIIFIILGAVFFWLNLNTPVQTKIPAIFLPIGFVMAVFSIGGMLT